MKKTKHAWEIIKWCEEHGYKRKEGTDKNYGHWGYLGLVSFTDEMIKYCNLPLALGATKYSWHPEWLIDEPDEDLTHEDVMTGNWWFGMGENEWRQVTSFVGGGCNNLEYYYHIENKWYLLEQLSKLPRSKCPKRRSNGTDNN